MLTELKTIGSVQDGNLMVWLYLGMVLKLIILCVGAAIGSAAILAASRGKVKLLESAIGPLARHLYPISEVPKQATTLSVLKPEFFRHLRFLKGGRHMSEEHDVF